MREGITTPWQKTDNVFELIRSLMYPSALQLFDCMMYNCIKDKTIFFSCDTKGYIDHYSTTYEQLTEDFLFVSSFSICYQQTLKRPRGFGRISLLATCTLSEDYIDMPFMLVRGASESFVQPSKSKFVNSNLYWQIIYGKEAIEIDLKEIAKELAKR